MQELRFRTLTQQGLEVWPSTQQDFLAAGHQFFASQTTLKPALDMALTQPNEKSRVSAIYHVASTGARAKMQNNPEIISIAKEMTENKRIFICRGSD